MSLITIVSGTGANYRGGSYNSGGSQMIGWDARLVRAEVYDFTTGSWPVSHISFTMPSVSLYQGSDIPFRFGISSSETAYVNSYGWDVGYEINWGGKTELDISLAANTTYYITFFPGNDRGSGWGLFTIDNSAMWIDATQMDRTACTAPTSLSLNKSIQTPGQNVTLSWSGAKAGTGVSIASYNVYRSESSGSGYTYLTNTTSTSCSVAAPPATKYYYYKVIAKANIAGYDSGYSNASAGLKGNSPPNAPSVSANRTVVPSYGGNVTFTVTAGTDPDGQTRTLYYSTSSSGTKTLFTSPLTINIKPTSPLNYYFYTYDGLAYSSITSAATKSITINDKPVINAATCVEETLGFYSALGGSGETGSQLGYVSSISPKISTSKKGTITVDLEYYSSDNTTAWDSTSVSRATVQNSAISSTTDVVLNNYNIHQYISLGTTNIHWRLRFKLTDSLESSDYVYYPSSSSGEYYAIARPSPLLASYNQFANSDIIGTITGEIWRNVRLKVYDDTSVPLVSAAATVNGAAVAATAATTTDNEYRYIDITLPDGLDSGATINVTAQMKDSGNSITKNISTTVTETTLPTLDVLSHGAPSIKPFTDTGTFAISSAWPFGSYETIDSTTLAAYNCDTTVSNVIRFVLSSDSSAEGSNRVVKTLYSPWTKSGDSITASLDKSTIYDWNNSLGITSYSGSRTYYCRIEIENLFEKVISTPWLSRTFDFREPVQSPIITSIEWSSDEVTWTTLGANDKLQEGIYVRFNCSFGLYTTDEIKVSVLLTNSSGERSVGCYEFGSPTKITPITYLNTELTRASNRTVATNTKSYVYHITTEIADIANRQWRLQFENTGGITNSSYSTTGVTRQCSPDIVFVSCTTDQDYYLTYAYTMTDNGGADTLTNYLCDEVDKAEITTALSGTSGTIQAKQAYQDWEVKTISIKSVSVVTGLITNTKNYYFNAIIVYQISPTVAYRKNQLGVNTDNPTSNSILDIHQSTGRETILIQGLDSSIPPKTTKFEVNVTTGEIKFYLDGTLKNTVDLLNGFLT